MVEPCNVVVGADSCWFWAMMQFFAIAISLGLITRQIVLQRIGHSITIISDLEQRWRGKKLLAARIDISNRLLNGNLSIDCHAERVLGFFENIGLFCRKKAIDKDIIWELYSYWIDGYWNMFQSQIEDIRNSSKDDSWYTHFEYLYNECVRISKKKSVPVMRNRKEDMEFFANDEKEREKVVGLD